ncbi:transposable element Tc3 transposase [Trichonephila clavipes]|nr:transposable element Tc3 transposase [Trichonephila clavipes]
MHCGHHNIGLVVFSDESRFSLQSDSCRTLIWRAPGTRYYEANTIERHRYGGVGWLVWGRIILGPRTDLHFQSVTMTGHIYRDVILEQHVRLFRGAMGAEFLFMNDNARPHRANIVDECLQSEDITRFDWPAYSLDLNPIDNVWNMLRRRIASRQPPPTCLPEIRRTLFDEWCNILQDQINNLILSIPMRFNSRWNIEKKYKITGRKSGIYFNGKDGTEVHFSSKLTPRVLLRADGPTTLEQPTLNHVQSDTMESAVLADPTRALQGTNRGKGPAMEESENAVGNLEQLLLYADEHYLAERLSLGEII